MRLDTMLSKNEYKLPNDWHKLGQVELKVDMTRFMMETPEFQDFMFKLATYSDYQFGQMCVRLANKN